MSDRTSARDRETRPDWRENALSLGVNPDQPDDWVYWQELERATKLVDSFSYHKPSPEQIERISDLRAAFRHTAKLILRKTPPSADQTAALRLLHEAMMTANKAIALEPGTPVAP